MTQQDIQKLAQIYNNLLTIKISGDDVFVVADNLRVMRDFIYEKQAQLNNVKDKED